MRLLIIPLFLAGCASTVPNAPSLLPRPIEKLSSEEPAPPPAATADPALDAAITRLGAVFDEKNRAFSTAADAASVQIAGGGQAAEGSDAWLDAQARIAELGQVQAEGATAIAELEALAIERATDGKPPYPALDARIAAAQVELDRSSARFESLKARVPGL